MTRDDARAKCIEAMALAELHHEYGLVTFSPVQILEAEARATAAFDSLHGIARVNPIEATEEMMMACSEATGLMPMWANSWRAMSAVGDLTNQPEMKP
jgi:hypothetical protein